MVCGGGGVNEFISMAIEPNDVTGTDGGYDVLVLSTNGTERTYHHRWLTRKELAIELIKEQPFFEGTGG